MAKKPSPTDALRLLTIRQFCELSGFGPSKVNYLIRDGELPVVKVGYSTRIRREDADAWFASLQTKRVA